MATTSHLRRLLGLGFALAVSVGGTAGTSVLTAPGDLVRALGSPQLVLVLWVGGGLFTLLAANTLAELAGRLPQAGGWYGYAEAAFGEFPAVVVAWADWTSSCVAGGLVALLLGDYLGQLLPAPLAGHTTLLAAAAILLLGLLQWRGPRSAGWAQEATAGLLILVMLGLVAASGLLPAAPRLPNPGRLLVPGASLVGALQIVVFAYDGWYGPIYFAEETPQPGRTLARALLLGTGIILTLYFLLNFMLLRALPWPRFTASTLPLAEIAHDLLGPPGRRAVLVLAVAALGGVLNSVLLMATRVLFALGRAGHLPAALGRVHAGGTPRLALGVAVALTLVLALSGTVPTLEAITSILFVGYYVVGFAALLKVRRLSPTPPDGSYRAWGHPWSTGLLVALSVAFLVLNVVADTVHAAVALLLVVGAWPLWRWKKAREAQKPPNSTAT
ncbi:APC family permease [Hymenobacter sp. ASUV-10]|uniref:APC family permease n=1 Tax=Hymenobacter aranciens TaxID=3063996 RepID=A0ABT9BC41_9BACT|nr:APC family permease [Hymenobacter sp. ASUV-10]MDO7875836.1 APC family permease [Hymenobacter sp. ASUV-10]